MSYCNKTGTTYRSNPEEPTGLLPTKNGYEQFVIRPIKLDKSWIPVNNTIGERDGT